MIQNPILSGFYPDPSLCRVGEDFYLVNSTFAYFPGLPVFHSKDLVTWKQIGNAIDRKEQLDFSGDGTSRGLFAPTIRHHNGVFYIVCTHIDKIGNFVITALDPAGPWSDPVILGAPGIDPTLFFDDDGSVWYVGNRPAPEGEKYSGNWEVWIQEVDISLILDKTGRSSMENSSGKSEYKTHAKKTGEILIGPSKGIWRGALRECIWPEGPHIYKINGWYYLLIAEGGTGPDHAVSVARCRTLDGVWEGKKSNPVVTHRHLGNLADIVNVGHADLFSDPKGSWWMVLLASRPYASSPDNKVSNLGRETFIVPIRWQDEWPFIGCKSGMIDAEYPSFMEADECRTADDVIGCDHFTMDALPLNYLQLRNPHDKSYSLAAHKGCLRLFTCGSSLRTSGITSAVFRRQQHFSWQLSTHVSFNPSSDDEKAGLVLYQNENYQYRLEAGIEGGKRKIELIKAAGASDETIARVFTDFTDLYLKVCARKQSLSFYYGNDKTSVSLLADNCDGSILSTEKAGGFVGTVLGMFASGKAASQNFADFHWFEYIPL